MHLPPIGCFKSACFYFLFTAYCLFLAYNILFLSINKQSAVVELASVLCKNPMGPGFESQVPQNAYYYFVSSIQACFINYGPPYAFRSQYARWPPSQIWWSRLSIHHMPRSTCQHEIGKVKRGLQQMGQTIAILISRIRPKPPIGLFLFFLYFFYLIVLFIYYFY